MVLKQNTINFSKRVLYRARLIDDIDTVRTILSHCQDFFEMSPRDFESVSDVFAVCFLCFHPQSLDGGYGIPDMIYCM